jgi:hypothetical protein
MLGAALLAFQRRKGMKGKKSGGRYAANVMVTIRVTPEEKTRLAEQAALAGLFLSEYLRRRFFGDRPVIHRVDEWMIRELRRLGGLLNTISRRSGWPEQNRSFCEGRKTCWQKSA